ncbi:MAG: low molecular weight phosphotyrosine protein phosphatase [Gammaproteobacteria bacterium]|nr:MAG: low molecular weight phosphotyrosine protein phosphatase [Gammaproteobacteria bacterium]
MNQTGILFVCLGNICRSPTAEDVFRARAAQAGLANRLRIDSCGTGHWHVGEPPDPRAVQAARERGYDLSALRARQVSDSDFQNFEYILAMDSDNLAHLRRMAPSGFTGHLGLFLDFAPGHEGEPVPDPYYGGDAGFAHVLDLIERASEGLLAHLSERLND